MKRWIVAAGVLLSGPAVAQEEVCSEMAVQHELTQCEYEDWQAADAVLNALYGEALAKAQARDAWAARPGEAEDLLRAAQRAWVAYRDADCEVEASFFRGGQAEPMIRYGCMRQHTEARSQLLRYYLEK